MQAAKRDWNEPPRCGN